MKYGSREFHAPIVKRGRHWVILNREGQVMRGQRFKSRKAAEHDYAHYLDLGGEHVHVERELPPERVPRGYVVSRSGHVRRKEKRSTRSYNFVESGRATRFRKDDES